VGAIVVNRSQVESVSHFFDGSSTIKTQFLAMVGHYPQPIARYGLG